MKSTDPSGTELTGAGLGQPADVAQLTEGLYAELRRLARGAMRGERRDHTLQSTALVNEAYLRLREGRAAVESRAHFLALAARVMRQVLIDHARGRERQKRGGDFRRVSLTEADPSSDRPHYEILALDQALDALKAFDPRRARLLELQLFAGLTYGEMAEALGCSEATVHRELRLARAWLHRQLAPAGPAP
ncbi:MAG: ECF-type sigma factor [Acidobacteriota bacterium]